MWQPGVRRQGMEPISRRIHAGLYEDGAELLYDGDEVAALAHVPVEHFVAAVRRWLKRYPEPAPTPLVTDVPQDDPFG